MQSILQIKEKFVSSVIRSTPRVKCCLGDNVSIDVSRLGTDLTPLEFPMHV
jgi:hypothetical protein